MKVMSKAKRITWYKREQCKKDGIPFDLDEQWIFERLVRGCELTGLPFVLDSKGKPHPMSASIDRVNPKGGYLKENCRIILNGLNVMRGDEPDSVMFKIARALVEPKDEVRLLIEPELRYLLSQHFTDRQVEIIFKKKHQLCLDKTEGEYYSRSIKKKLKELMLLTDWASQIVL